MAEEKQRVSRRKFGKALAQAGTATAAAAAAAGSALAQAPATPAPAQAPAAPAAPAMGPVVVGNYGLNDQIVFGGIGIRGRGMGDLRMLLGDSRVKFVAIADVRESAREMVKSTVDNYYKNNDCKMYRDPAEILARQDIDALLIATSDRWHGPMAMWAAQSGKDMYIEKPGAMSITESYAHGRQRAPLRRGVPVGRPAEEPVRLSSSPWAWRAAASWAGCSRCTPTPRSASAPWTRAGTAGGRRTRRSRIRWSSIGTSGWARACGGRTTPPTRTAAAASSGISTPVCSSGRRTPSPWRSGPPTWSTPSRSSTCPRAASSAATA